MESGFHNHAMKVSTKQRFDIQVLIEDLDNDMDKTPNDAKDGKGNLRGKEKNE